MRTRNDEIRESCQKFSDKHPLVWDLFEKFAFDRINKGFKHYSNYAVFEQIRWHTDQADVDGKSEFKLNNNFPPFYARRFMKMYPEHEGFFRVRHQTSLDNPPLGLPELGPGDFS